MPRDESGAAARPIDAPPGITPRIGAVLVLLYPAVGGLHVPLTVRTASLRTHSGEISLPGGGFDQEDGILARTALREAWEARPSEREGQPEDTRRKDTAAGAPRLRAG